MLMATLAHGVYSGPSNANATSVDITQAAGFWTQAVAEGNLSSLNQDLSDVRLWVEGQARFNNSNPMNNMNWYQGMARTALGYAITDRATIWAGYTYLPTQIYGKPYMGEQDVWPAFRYIFPSSIGTFTFREMVENRFVRGDAPGVRSRTLLRLLHPLGFEPRLGLLVWDEAFFNLNNVPNNPLGGLSGFNQNRAFVGMSWTFSQSLRAEFGYMNQLVNRSVPSSSVNTYGSLNAVSASVFYGW